MYRVDGLEKQPECRLVGTFSIGGLSDFTVIAIATTAAYDLFTKYSDYLSRRMMHVVSGVWLCEGVGCGPIVVVSAPQRGL